MLKLTQNCRNVNLIKNFRMNFSNVSRLQQVNQRDQEFLKNVVTQENYSQNEFSNFLRVLNKNGSNEEALKKFTQELPKHINYLDDLDTRKAISVLLNNHSLHSNNKLIVLLKERFTEIRKMKHMSSDSTTIKIGTEFRSQPYSIRFWIMIARLRERMYMIIRAFNLNLK